MTDNNKDDKDNLIDLASERLRFQNRPSQSGPKKFGTQSPLLAGKKSAPPSPKAGPRWYHYVQLLAFLAFLAWMMQQCMSRGF